MCNVLIAFCHFPVWCPGSGVVGLCICLIKLCVVNLCLMSFCCIYLILLLNMPEMAKDWINKSISSTKNAVPVTFH